MQENRLPKHFLIDNPLTEMSKAQITYFQIEILSMPEVYEKMESIVAPMMEISRREEYQKEKEQIIKIDTADDYIKFMRNIKEVQNRKLLVEKGLAMEEDVMPLILKRMLTSGHDVFIENAATIFAIATTKYVDQLYDVFNEIRNPYAKSLACLAFGIKKKMEYTPLLLEQYKLIKQERPDRDYEQGPLLALHLIHGK